jgi:hypothetical protein
MSAAGFKDASLHVAEAIDALRLWPRLVLIAYGYWTAHLTDWIVKWYERLPGPERTPEVTAFVTIVLPGVFGLAIWVYRIYANTGRDWSASRDPVQPS